jgi:hypothetical protein
MSNLNVPKNLYDYIDLTKERTALYTGEKSLSAMNSHILGYQMACFYKEIEENLIPEFGKFNDFVATYYNYEESTAGWKNIMLWENQNDELLALEKFYILLDQFRKKPEDNL